MGFVGWAVAFRDKTSLSRLDDAAGHAPAGTPDRLCNVIVRGFVDDEGGPVRVEQRIIPVLQAHQGGKELGFAYAVRADEKIGQIAGLRSLRIHQAVCAFDFPDVAFGGFEPFFRLADTVAMQVQAVLARLQIVDLDVDEYAGRRLGDVCEADR